jgi:hypothetical protein
VRKKILIVAKTYPTKSKKYTELVCTAGVDEEGSWYRIYPIPTKTLKEYEGLKKYTWIDAQIEKDHSDIRPESHKINISTIKLLETIPTDHRWRYRKDIVLKTHVYRDMREIIHLANDQNTLSLCLFKPTKFLHIYFESKKTETLTSEEITAYKNANANLFEHSSSCEVEFNAMPPLPFDIKLNFEDINGKKSKMNILDWEISQLYWTLEKRGNNQREIKQGIKNKLREMIDKKDLYLYLGTMRQMHGWTSNPFTIIGLFYPPKDGGYSPSLFG